MRWRPNPKQSPIVSLEVAQTSAGIVARVTPGDQGGEARSPSVRQLLETVVAENREVDGAFVGWPDGSFLYVTRSLAEAPDGYRVKQIVTSPRRVATEWQIASDFSELAETNLSDDEFDPRSRPWYRSALTQDIGWTATYEFASSGEPGITHFRTVVEETGIAAVVGIDMQLRAGRDVPERTSTRRRRHRRHGFARRASHQRATAPDVRDARATWRPSHTN